MYKRFIIFSVNQQYQDLDACLQRLGKPGNPHPPSVRLNNLLLVQLGFLIEQKQNNNQDIEKLFHKLFPNNEYHLGSVRSLTTIAHKNFQKLKQNKKKVWKTFNYFWILTEKWILFILALTVNKLVLQSTLLSIML